MYLLVKLRLDNNTILKIIKPLYRVPKVKNHWFNTYRFDYYDKLLMTQSIYNFCLLYTKNSSGNRFEIVGFETDNTLFLSNKTFIIKKEE